jgi:hypothetical protein
VTSIRHRSPGRRRDLAEAKAWYDDKRPGLGDEFLAAIADAFTRLEQTPSSLRSITATSAACSSDSPTRCSSARKGMP